MQPFLIDKEVPLFQFSEEEVNRQLPPTELNSPNRQLPTDELKDGFIIHQLATDELRNEFLALFLKEWFYASYCNIE
jgi:hypothetical protein